MNLSPRTKESLKRYMYALGAIFTFYALVALLVIFLGTEPASSAREVGFDSKVDEYPALQVYDGPSTMTEPPFQKTIPGTSLQKTANPEDFNGINVRIISE